MKPTKYQKELLARIAAGATLHFRGGLKAWFYLTETIGKVRSPTSRTLIRRGWGTKISGDSRGSRYKMSAAGEKIWEAPND